VGILTKVRKKSRGKRNRHEQERARSKSKKKKRKMAKDHELVDTLQGAGVLVFSQQTRDGDIVARS
jgi:hypothetical protein